MKLRGLLNLLLGSLNDFLRGRLSGFADLFDSVLEALVFKLLIGTALLIASLLLLGSLLCSGLCLRCFGSLLSLQFGGLSLSFGRSCSSHLAT